MLELHTFSNVPLSAPAPLQADYNNYLIRRIEISSGLVSTLAGTVGAVGSVNGRGTAASFSLPYGVSMDNSGTFAFIVSNI